MMTELQHGSSDRPTDDIVLVHSSDLHVDDDLGIGAYNGLIGLASVLATARSLAADIVLLAGDTFDNHRVSAPVLARATALLATAGVPVVLLPGNHDSVMPQCLFHRAGIIGLPDIHVLGVTNAGSILFERHGLEIWGHAHCGFGDMAPLRTPRLRTTRWQVAMAHGHYVPPEECIGKAIALGKSATRTSPRPRRIMWRLVIGIDPCRRAMVACRRTIPDRLIWRGR